MRILSLDKFFFLMYNYFCWFSEIISFSIAGSQNLICGYGEIGIRTRFRFWRSNPCRFNSCYPHQCGAPVGSFASQFFWDANCFSAHESYLFRTGSTFKSPIIRAFFFCIPLFLPWYQVMERKTCISYVYLKTPC